jgi:putative cardiolipin synthase
VIDSPGNSGYKEAMLRTPQIQSLLAGELKVEWTTARVVSDDPAKTLRPGSDTELQLLPKLVALFGPPATGLNMVSPYFVPGEAGTEALSAIARRGVEVRILTNSLAATDEVSVHSGYARRRVDLLRAGVQLFEIKPTATVIRQRAAEIGSHSQAGLHAKTFEVDRKSIFVGSFNLDPRSARLNTEMGLVIDSPALATRLSSMFDRASPDQAWRLTLDDNGDPQWHDGPTTLHSDPEASWGRRLKVRIFSWLPIEWLL